MCCVAPPLVSDAQPYQWSCSALESTNNRWYLPNLGEDFNDNFSGAYVQELNLHHSFTDVIYIYPVPQTLNCTGRVTAVRYCYRARDGQVDGGGDPLLVFLLFVLRRQQLDTIFEVVDIISVQSMPTDKKCSRRSNSEEEQDCCDVHILLDKFDLPPENFAFATRAFDEDDSVRLLSMHELSQFHVAHYRVGIPDDPISVGGTINVGDKIEEDRSLRLLQFLVSKSVDRRWLYRSVVSCCDEFLIRYACSALSNDCCHNYHHYHHHHHHHH